jgi:rubrerythrin
MDEHFGLADLYTTLIFIEETGSALYAGLAAGAGDEQAARLFRYLAEQERRHRQIYQGMKDRAQPAAEVDAEYRDYLRALTAETLAALRRPPAAGYTDALDTGIRLEKETLLFLGELDTLVGEDHPRELLEIKTQERAHLRLLLDLRHAARAP